MSGKRFLLAVALSLSACSSVPKKVVCPSVVGWPSDFQKEVASELTAHPATEMPGFHEMALLAVKQRRINKACVK